MRFSPILLLSVMTAGCTSIVSDSIDAAPEWFQERKEQLSGEGYPSFEQAAKMNADVEEAPWKVIAADLAVALKEMKAADPGPVTMTAADMRAWAAEQKALVAKGEEPY